MEHRKYGGSTAQRTISCPGWHQESDGIPRQTSVFANTGAALHSCMEEMILDGKMPDHFIGLIIEGVEITFNHVVAKLAPALDAFYQLCGQYGVEDYEPEVEASYAEDIGGYADVILRGMVDKKPAVIVLDWKFGDGILVSPYDSPQTKFYGMACRKDSSAKDLFDGAEIFVAAIIQPTDRAETLSTWEAPIDVLDQFEKQHARAVKESLSAHPPLNTGEHCHFCPAAAVCPQKTGQALRALQMQPDDLDNLTESLDLVSELKPWIKAVERTAFEQLEVGAGVTGWKLVAKRAIAKWTNEREVMVKFARRLGGKKYVVTEKLITPAAMIKLAKSKGKKIDFEPYIVRASSGNTMAPEDDKRPAVLSAEALQAALASIE